jgi:hypothetical protein
MIDRESAWCLLIVFETMPAARLTAEFSFLDMLRLDLVPSCHKRPCPAHFVTAWGIFACGKTTAIFG